VVPAGVYAIRVVARGASGAQVRKTAESGHGAVVSGGFAVTPGQVLQIYVADGDAHGYGTGGRHGEVAGSAHDGAAAGGASAVVSSSPLVIAGGGGGGGGDNKARGGNGGNGGTPYGVNGSSPGYIQSWDGSEYINENIHPGCGGCASGGNGGKGDDDYAPDDAGGGGGGGGGAKGGDGGQHGYTFRMLNGNFHWEITEEGGAGGGGGSSYFRSDAIDPGYAVDSGCQSNGTPSPACEGLVSLSWGAPPAAVTTIKGDGQGAPLTASFEPIAVRVTDANGLPLAGEPVTFTLPSSGPSGVLPGRDPTLVVDTDDTGVATLYGLASQGPVGAWKLTASAPGVASTQISLLNQAIPVEVALNSTPDPSTAAEALEISAQVIGTVGRQLLPVTGAVQFALDGTDIGGPVALDTATGTARLPAGSVPAPPAGAHTITADYLGDASHAAQNAGHFQLVNYEPTALSVEGTPNPVSDGSPLDLRATIRTQTAGPEPTGTVSFESDEVALGSAPLEAGVATLHLGSLPLGSHEISAIYSGDARFAAGAGLEITVVGDATVALALSSSANLSTFGAGTRIEAEIRRAEPGPDPVGTVDFTVDGNPFCSDVQTATATASCELPDGLAAGNHTVRAAFEPAVGSGDDPAAGALVQVVAPAPTTDTLAATPAAAIFDKPFALASTVLRGDGAAATGSVRFQLDRFPAGPPVALESGHADIADACAGAAPGGDCPLGVGVHTTVSEFRPADGNLRLSRATTLIHVDPEPTRTGVRLAAAPSGPTASFQVTVVAPRGEAEGSVQFLVDGRVIGAPVALVDGAVASPTSPQLAAGPHQVVVHYLGAERFEPSEAKLGFETGSAAARPKLRLLGREARVRSDGTVRIWAACDGAAGTDCDGTVYLRLPGIVKKNGTQKLVGRAHIELAGGSTGASELTLRRPARAMLSKRRTLEALASVSGEDGNSRLRLRSTPAPLLVAEAVHRRYRAFLVHLRCEPPVHSSTRGCDGVVDISANSQPVGAAPVSTNAAGPITARISLPRDYAEGPDVEVEVRVRSQVAVGEERISTGSFEVRLRRLGSRAPAR
jgi:hypothetical protein